MAFRVAGMWNRQAVLIDDSAAGRTGRIIHFNTDTGAKNPAQLTPPPVGPMSFSIDLGQNGLATLVDAKGNIWVGNAADVQAWGHRGTL